MIRVESLQYPHLCGVPFCTTLGKTEVRDVHSERKVNIAGPLYVTIPVFSAMRTCEREGCIRKAASKLGRGAW